MLRGSILAQVASVLGGLYMAKLFGPENYGIYGSIISIASIIALLFTLQLDKAVVLSKEFQVKKEWISFLIPFIVVIASLTILILYSTKISIDKYSNTILILSILVGLSLAIIWIYEALLTSNKSFKILSNSKVIVSVIVVVSQFIFYKMSLSEGLIYGFLLAQFLVILYYFFIHLNYLEKLNFKATKSNLNNHKDILQYLLPSNVINGIGVHVMPILIVAYFDLKIAAVYFLSLKLLSLPLHLMTSSIGNVFFEKASQTEATSTLFIRTKKIVITNIGIMLIFLIAINTIGIYILEYFFDDKWENLSFFLLIMSFLFLARSSFNPISSLIVVKRKNHIGLLFNIYLVIVNIAAIWVGFINKDIRYTIYILSGFGGIGYFTLLFYFGKLLKNAR